MKLVELDVAVEVVAVVVDYKAEDLGYDCQLRLQRMNLLEEQEI